MASGSKLLRCRLQFSIRTLLLLFVPVGLVIALIVWLFCPIDVAITVDGFSRFQTVTLDNQPVTALGAHVRATNRSRHTVWYLKNPRYYLFQYVDGQWRESWTGTELPENRLWSAQEGLQSISMLVGISEKATAFKVGIAFTTDRFRPKAHWVFSPVVKVTRKGQDYTPEVVARNGEETALEARFGK